MSSTDTCVVRPELMEFEKFNGTSSLFLSVVAHPDVSRNDGSSEAASFKFTKKSSTMVSEASVGDLTYGPEELADLYAQQLYISNIEADRITEVTTLNMIAGGAGTIDLNEGNITKVTQLDFYEAGAGTMMNITNDSIVFGEPTGKIDMTQGDIINVQNIAMAADSVTDINDGNIINVGYMNLTPLTGEINLRGGTLKTGGGNIDMDGGAIINAVDLSVGEIRLHDTNKINNNAGNSLVLEGVDFKDANVSLMQTMTFVADTTGVLNMNDGAIDNVSTLNLNAAGTGVLDAKDGDIKNVENLDFGANLVINKEGSAETNAANAPMIKNPNGKIDMEGILFGDKTVDLLNTMTFTPGQANDANQLDMNNGLIDKVTTLNMNTDETGAIEMNSGDIRNVENMNFGPNLDIQRAGGQGGVPLINNANGAVDLEGILFDADVVSSITTMNFDAAGVIDMNTGTVDRVQTLNMTGAASTMNQLQTLNMTPDGTVNNLLTLNMSLNGVLNMNQSDMLDLKTAQLSDILTIGQVQVDGPNATITHTNEGIVTLEGVKFTDQNMTEVTNATFTAGGVGTLNLSDGVITNVLTQTMTTNGTLNMSGGKIDFGGSTGRLELKGASAVANIGSLNLANNTLKNQSDSGSVNVEESVFTDKEIKTLNINALGGADTTVSVEQTVFEGNVTSVDNLRVDTIKSRDGADLDIKASIVNLSDSATSNAIRITNVATPINDNDAANKAYVNFAVQENVQGLKPRKATDCSLFGGFVSAGQPSDFDKTAGSVFGSFDAFSIEFVPKNPVDGVDVSELKFHLQGTSPLTFDGLAFDENELAEIAASGAADGSTGPALIKKRVLVMNLTENSISAGAAYNNATLGGYAYNAPELHGLNGIWEIYTYEDHADVTGKTLTMKRAADMNESTEVLNGAYTYVKFGSRSNYGFVVSSKDPIKIADTGANQGLTIDGNSGNLMQLEWIEFNNIDFELSFVDNNGDQKELLANVEATFEKGGLVMKYEATDEKQVMVNAEMLRYETDVSAAGGLALQINGNVDFNLADADSHINSKSDAFKVHVNGTQFERQGSTFNLNTTNIVANTVTCESDRNLKTDIVDMKDGLDLVSKLRPVNYRWKDETKSQLEEYGFIAQEVEESFPSLVQTNASTGIKSVDYPKMVSILALAVQELTAKVQELSAK